MKIILGVLVVSAFVLINATLTAEYVYTVIDTLKRHNIKRKLLRPTLIIATAALIALVGSNLMSRPKQTTNNLYQSHSKYNAPTFATLTQNSDKLAGKHVVIAGKVVGFAPVSPANPDGTGVIVATSGDFGNKVIVTMALDAGAIVFAPNQIVVVGGTYQGVQKHHQPIVMATKVVSPKMILPWQV